MSIPNLKKRIKRAAELAEAKQNAESLFADITPAMRQQAEAELIEWYRSTWLESVKDTEPFSVVVGETPVSWKEELAEMEKDIHQRFAELPIPLATSNRARSKPARVKRNLL